MASINSDNKNFYSPKDINQTYEVSPKKKVGYSFGANLDERVEANLNELPRDIYLTSSPEEEKSFWGKFKKWIIGGVVVVGAGVLSFIGYKKGWFKKTADKVIKLPVSTNQNDTAPKWQTALETLNLKSLKVNNRSVEDMISKDSVTKDELNAVTKKLQTIISKDDKTKRTS